MRPQTDKQKKLFIGLIVGAGILILIGLLFVAILSKDNKELITKTITTFMNQVKAEKLNYQSSFWQSILSNVAEGTLLFFLGMSIIGIPITLGLFLAHAFTLGFSLSSIFYVYKWKGVLLGAVYILPQVMNIVILLILCYFSLLFSKYLFYLLFLKKDISFRRIMRRYVKVFGLSLILLSISSVIEVFAIPQVLSFLL